jgi:hypothetical protein
VLDEDNLAEARRLVEQAVAICEGAIGPANRNIALADQVLAEVELACS